ncbi:sugar ABC transporter ATP-binding protein [Bradyrhizobium manausense]|uniref:sugar ABC transporter ATP-binding protein n=1 Tax=Bradyrhizobium manausense TaxID=989370 RepID=UPI001BA5C695|nr:sugar ABC transporter ATP-binding protein [Bradyrhizobium manausense]MBR0725517.1 sugar ABC transporter ATP-binding protein [Bradyrhizobium manausense]
MSTSTPAQLARAIDAQRTVLRVKGLSRRYGQLVALEGVSLDVLPVEVHVLFGENGAGKSTLISIVAGAQEPSAGSIEGHGRPCRFDSVATARAHGVRAVFQEFSLVPHLSVAENVTLGEEPLNGWRLLSKGPERASVQGLIDQFGFDLDAGARVSALARGKQQMVEICKALKRMPKLLILDEPTASLSGRDTQALLALVWRLKEEGTAIIYVTHRMHEISLLGDRVTVLREGRFVKTVPADTSSDELIRLMSGREIVALYPKPRAEVGPVRLSLENVTLAPQPGVMQVTNASVEVRAGEIVGLAGLVGSGKSEFAQACFGLRRLTEGRVLIEGVPVSIKGPADAIRHKLWYSPADRKHDGLMLERNSRENIALSGLAAGPSRGSWLRPWQEVAYLSELASAVDLSAGRLNHRVATLSGGNQQKVLLAKSLVQDVKVFVFDEPTVGVDIGACMSIYRCLSELSARGAAVLLVSSNLPELMGLTHRLLVMSGGRLVGEFKRGAFDERRILERFF